MRSASRRRQDLTNLEKFELRSDRMIKLRLGHQSPLNLPNRPLAEPCFDGKTLKNTGTRKDVEDAAT